MSLRITAVPNPDETNEIPMLTCAVPDRTPGTLYVLRTSHEGRVLRHVYDGIEIESALAGCSLDAWMGATVELFELDFNTVGTISTAMSRIRSAEEAVDCDPQYEAAREELREYQIGLDRALAAAGY